MTSGAEWQGPVGQSWADEWQRTERAMAGIGDVLDAEIARVAPVAGRALDIGCGVGSTSLALTRSAPALEVVGVDLSAALVRVARERAAAAAALTFEAGDAIGVAERLAPNDLIVSRHGVMFFDDPAGAFARLRAAARPGAPLVFSCFRRREENEWARVLDAAAGVVPLEASGPGPFSLADHTATTDVLSHAGWSDVTAVPHDVGYVLGDGSEPVEEALAFTRRIGPAARVIAEAGAADRSRIEDRLRAAFASRVTGGRVSLSASVWIWTARAGDAP
ncbi:Methyltransferase domain-containing protein [Sphingomonas guangdongensis]|uniref:Methyltransferase domain-containing protein n=1 Tax=Sphingomonas guangdongensis TaxID=1141890 RepID=A0A285R273_9SPHN|nr:class I SAM-dependent methyltransferase [Sphingomonas guangdongensis]SOB87819.1 Methyltransferase domain-containing protein [Sphingomonas guangdongensis]